MIKNDRQKRRVVAVSGGFDPIHMGHIRYLNEAKKLGTELVVILNNDNWLKKKKGFVFMPEKERVELLKSIKSVDRVVLTRHTPNDLDRSVSKDLARLKPDVFANGGDRTNEFDIPETATCRTHNIRMIFGVGAGGKIQSSSWLTNKIARSGIFDSRPWGHEEIFKLAKHFWIKTLTIDAGHRFSLQKHASRTEVWVCLEGVLTAEINGRKKNMKTGTVILIPRGATHRLGSKKGGMVAEIAFGSDVREDDIIRLADDYGRI